jgi:chromosome segregation ATPase
VKKRPNRARGSDGGERTEALRASLDALEENITLLLARHESLAARAADEERRRSKGAIDPIELEKRVTTLEADKERLERHSAFLEERIRGLLSRVRYVIES